MEIHRHPASSLALGLIFLVPAVVKMANLVDAGRLRWVEALTVFVGGLVGGMLLGRATRAWRDRR